MSDAPRHLSALLSPSCSMRLGARRRRAISPTLIQRAAARRSPLANRPTARSRCRGTTSVTSRQTQRTGLTSRPAIAPDSPRH